MELLPHLYNQCLVNVSGYTSDNIKCWYFGTIILSFLKKIKVNVPFSEILIHTTVGLTEEELLFPEENVGLWLEFALLEVHRI